MIFHPIIDQIADIDMTLIHRVVRADEQKVEGQTACFCPFCKRGRVATRNGIENQNRNGSDTPHFIIYNDEYGGLYGVERRVTVNGERTKIRGVRRWRCTRTGRSGFGAIELYAAIHNIPLVGQGLQLACKRLVTEIYGEEQGQRKWPELFGAFDYRTLAEQDQETFTFQPKTDFTPQELQALGCEVNIVKGTVQFGFGTDFHTINLNRDFNVYSCAYCILPNARRTKDGEMHTEIIHGTPWNPLFFCTPDEKMPPDVGILFRPAMDDAPIVFSLTEEHTVAKVSKWLMGDKVLLEAMAKRDGHTTAVHAAMEKYEPDELSHINLKREKWKSIPKENGDLKYEKTEEDIPDTEQKARNVVLCHTPQDAIATYYMMRDYRMTHDYDSDTKDLCWFHVAFVLGRSSYWYIEHGEWKPNTVNFGNVQYNKLARFADNVIVLYPSDNRSQRECCNICLKYDKLRIAHLPRSFQSVVHQRYTWMYRFGRSPRSVRDFSLCYRMSDAERFRYDGDYRAILYNGLKSAVDSRPLEQKAKRDRNNAVREYYYVISSAAMWNYMACLGYYRSVEKDSENTIGRYLHIDGAKVQYIEESSMLKEVKDALMLYIEEKSRNSEEASLMKDAVYHGTREINLSALTSLPSIDIDYGASFSEKVEHFYFRNCVLRVTPDAMQTIPYSELDHYVDMRACLDWDFDMPRGQRAPFLVSENEEYLARKQHIEEESIRKDDNGNPMYNSHQIAKMRSDLMQWAQLHRWSVTWRDDKESDMWAPLRVLRGFVNINWRMEEETLRTGGVIAPDEKAFLDAHFVNLLYAIGKTLCQYKGHASQTAPYVTENSVQDAKRATGGSGKSSLTNIFIAASAKLYNIDCKKFARHDDLRFALGKFIPHVHRAVNWEDWDSAMSLTEIYNMVSGGLTTERKTQDANTLKVDDSPNHIITSNHPLSNSDDSTVGRFPLVPFSDRFCRDNQFTSKPGRSPQELMRDFTHAGPQYLTATSRNQIIYINALAVQFMQRYGTVVYAPMEGVKHRQMVRDLTEAATSYFDWFFSRKEVFAYPIDLKSCFEEYKRNFTEASDDKMTKYALKEFRNRCERYCEYQGIAMNPEHLYETESNRSTRYFHLSAWITHSYFADPRWEKDPDAKPKHVRVWGSSQNVCFFYRPEDKVPASLDELKQQNKRLRGTPDPLPYLDEDGNPVTITEMEKQQSKAGPGRQVVQQAAQLQVAEIKEEDLPF